MHVAVMLPQAHGKVATELVKRGAVLDSEDVMCITPLHLAGFIQSPTLDKSLAAAGKLPEPMSTGHHCTPEQLKVACTYHENSPLEIQVLEQWGGKPVKWGRMDMLVKLGVVCASTAKASNLYVNCMLSSMLDDDGKQMMQDATRQSYKAAVAADPGFPANLMLAKAESGEWGLYATEAITSGTYLCQIGGSMVEASESFRNGLTEATWLNLMPSLPFHSDTSIVRCAGAFLSHSEDANAKSEHMISSGVPTLFFYAQRDIVKGELIRANLAGFVSEKFVEQKAKMPLQLPAGAI